MKKKHLFKILVAVVATSAMLFAACGKEDGVTECEWIDMGLPSGLLWYSCNLGATAPEGYGDYYAWGETTTKSTYDWNTYQYANGDNDIIELTKYCNYGVFGYNAFTDNLTTLLPEDDAATQVLGGGARIPTQAEWEELIDNTTVVGATTINGVHGALFTAANGNTLFLPAAGYRHDDTLDLAGGYGSYWSASLDENIPIGAYYFGFQLSNQGKSKFARCLGRSVRAVRAREN